MGHDHAHASRGRDQRRLVVVLALTAVVLVVQVVGGLWTGSLALLADAGHLLTDVVGLGLALFAMKVAERPPTAERTYGYHRVEILAALVNGAVLVGIAVFILYEAGERFRNPPEVASGAMLALGVLGLSVNVAGVVLLRSGSARSLNLRGAYYEVLSDLLSSLGVIAAAAVMWTTGWYYADPIVSAAIGVFILPRTWSLMREAVHVLLEGTPAHIELAAVRRAIEGVPGVDCVHDLHVWTLTSHSHVLTAHAVLVPGASDAEVLGAIRETITARFEIGHVTIQVERQGCEGDEMHL
ncbi:MAG TPA: cation diffusion facilitator family transporter [Vicinamibacteria bacterium]|nr:cation diffusion facilitator family transporter [Vicinamibacteria bacterium]